MSDKNQKLFSKLEPLSSETVPHFKNSKKPNFKQTFGRIFLYGGLTLSTLAGFYIEQQNIKKVNQIDNELVNNPIFEKWVTEPATNSYKVLIPGVPLYEYYHYKSHSKHIESKELTEKETTNKDNHDYEHMGAGGLILKELEILSKVLFELAKEEIYTETVLIYLLAKIPKLQHYLFLVLVSKARLTSFVLKKIETILEKMDNSLNSIIHKTTNSKSDFGTNIKKLMNKDEVKPSKVINTASVIQEIQLIRNFLTQVKLSLQLPMMFGHSRSLVHAYLSLNDFASPRFSSELNPDVLDQNSNNKNLKYRTLIGENDVGEEFDNNIQNLSQKLHSENSTIENFWEQVILPSNTNTNLNNIREFWGSKEPVDKIVNEDKIGDVQRLVAYQEYFGTINTQKIRLMYYTLMSIVDFFANVKLDDVNSYLTKSGYDEYNGILYRDSVDMKFYSNVGYNTKKNLNKDETKAKGLILQIRESLGKSKDTNKTEANETEDSQESTTSKGPIQDAKWVELVQSIFLLSRENLDQNTKKWLMEVASIADMYSLEDKDLFLENHTDRTVNNLIMFLKTGEDEDYSRYEPVIVPAWQRVENALNVLMVTNWSKKYEKETNIKKSEIELLNEYIIRIKQTYLALENSFSELFANVDDFGANLHPDNRAYAQRIIVKRHNKVNALEDKIFKNIQDMVNRFESMGELGAKSHNRLRLELKACLAPLYDKIINVNHGLWITGWDLDWLNKYFENKSDKDIHKKLSEIEKTIDELDYNPKLNVSSSQMPNWTIPVSAYFDPKFLEFLHHYRFQSDIVNFRQQNWPRFKSKDPSVKITLDQRINLWVKDPPKSVIEDWTKWSDRSNLRDDIDEFVNDQKIISELFNQNNSNYHPIDLTQIKNSRIF